MAISILITAIIGLFVGGITMSLWSKRAAQLDASISFGIARVLFPKRMKRVWRRAEGFKKNAGRKSIIMIYKTAGIAALILGIGLTIFLVNLS